MRGRWRIVEMDLWDREAFELLGPASIEFEKGGFGDLRFIAVECDLDWREEESDGRRVVQFTLEGVDEGDRVSGRGWAVPDDDGSLLGHIYFHLGDDSGFRAERMVGGSPPER